MDHQNVECRRLRRRRVFHRRLRARLLCLLCLASLKCIQIRRDGQITPTPPFSISSTIPYVPSPLQCFVCTTSSSKSSLMTSKYLEKKKSSWGESLRCKEVL